MSLAVKQFTSLVVKRFTSLAVKQVTILAVKQSTSLVVRGGGGWVGELCCYPSQKNTRNLTQMLILTMSCFAIFSVESETRRCQIASTNFGRYPCNQIRVTR